MLIENLPDSFNDKIWPEPMSGCWLWGGTLKDSGYGVAMLGPKKFRVHRVVWAAVNGPIPDGMHVLHRCDNRACCNPDHLFLGTHQENIADRHRKGRDACNKGEDCGKSKLNNEAVLSIRHLYAAGEQNQYELADMFGVNQSTIGQVVRRKTWRHI